MIYEHFLGVIKYYDSVTSLSNLYGSFAVISYSLCERDTRMSMDCKQLQSQRFIVKY